MAVVWPSKNNFANGDVLTAANMNNIGDTLNVFNPTSATNGQVWVANGSGSGSYSTPAGGWTLINSGTLSGSSITSSSFSGYQQIHIDIVNAVVSTTANTQIRLNGLSTSIYSNTGIYNTAGPALAVVADNNQAQLTTQGVGSQSTDTTSYAIDIFNANQTTTQKVVVFNVRLMSTAAANYTIGNGRADIAAALTSVTIRLNTGTWSSGNYYFYGLK